MLKLFLKSLKSKGYEIIEYSYSYNIRNDKRTLSYFFFTRKNKEYRMLSIIIKESELEEMLKIEGDTKIIEDLIGKIEGCNGIYCIYEIRINRGYSYTKES